MIKDCETLAIDLDWDLTRKNACHIANQNDEMGTLSETQASMNFRLKNIETYITVNTWIWAVIAASVISIAIKKIFKNGS